jgi:ribosomal protein S18 acetylase RimI-like enzyme
LGVEFERVSIRPARNGDAAAITRLVRQLAASLGEFSPVDDDFVLHSLDTPGGGILVADAEGEVIGMLSYTLRPSLYHSAPACMIEELVVSEGFRRGRIGGRLLNALVSLARDRGCAEVSVSAMESNKEAVEFYLKHGFEAGAVLLEQHLTRED